MALKNRLFYHPYNQRDFCGCVIGCPPPLRPRGPLHGLFPHQRPGAANAHDRTRGGPPGLRVPRYASIQFVDTCFVRVSKSCKTQLCQYLCNQINCASLYWFILNPFVTFGSLGKSQGRILLPPKKDYDGFLCDKGTILSS